MTVQQYSASERKTEVGVASSSPGDRAQRSNPIIKVLIYTLTTVLALGVLYPLFWMFTSALKTNSELYGSPWALPSSPQWDNFVQAWEQGVVAYFTNSALVTIGSVVTTLFISSLAAYGLTRLTIPFSPAILVFILGGLMLPPAVALIPLFRLMQTLGLYNSLWALLILYTAFRIPFTTFLIRAYMSSIPRSLEEAAMIDGASRWRIFLTIVLPMCKPILISAGLLQAMFAWNEFAFALVLINSDSLKTLPIGLAAMQSTLNTNWPVLFAALAIASIPLIVVFLSAQRHFVRGLGDGAIK